MLIFNNRSFMSKKLRKETMKRSKCNKNCNQNRNHENSCEYKYQNKKLLRESFEKKTISLSMQPKIKTKPFTNSFNADINQLFLKNS